MLNIYFVIFRYVTAAATIIAAASVLCRDMLPESKVSWLAVLVFLPLFGLTVYILFSFNTIGKKEKSIVKKFKEQTNALAFNNTPVERYLSPEQLIQSDYIESVTGRRGYINTDVRHYPYGERFFADFLNDLESARDFVFLEYFLLAEGEMLSRVLSVLERKAALGVDVRIIYDDFGSADRINPKYAAELNKKGIKTIRFNKMIPFPAAYQNNRNHRKITVIDGKIGYTGGINIADEYINLISPYGVWKDTAIRLEGPAVDALSTAFLSDFFSAEKAVEPIDRFVGKAENMHSRGVVLPFCDGPKHMYNRYVTENAYINLINSARRYVWISTPYLVYDGRIKKSLVAAAERGADVRIVVPHIPDKKLVFEIGRNNYKALQKYGIKIYEYEPGFIHAKQLVCDGTTAIVGTANLDYRSLLYNYENAVLLFNTDCISDIEKDFISVFNRSVLMDGFEQNALKNIFCKIARTIAPLL
ncbi:MAG: cardiolipin synthase [Clostridiales bacterium]|nr:cardiolipin synthase [Clostridiales bacterium]